MTPEEIKQKARIIKQAFNDDEGLNLLVHAARCVDELESSALRLAAIEAAGDEEVDRACDGLMKSYRSLDDSLFHRSMNALDDIAKSRNATIADLRAKLGETVKLMMGLLSVAGVDRAMLQKSIDEYEASDDKKQVQEMLKG